MFTALGVCALLRDIRQGPLWARLLCSCREPVALGFFLLLASASLIASFLTHDFAVSYVAQHSSLAMPWYFTTAAFYGGQEGSQTTCRPAGVRPTVVAGRRGGPLPAT